MIKDKIAPFIRRTEFGLECAIDGCGPYKDISTMISHFKIFGLDPVKHADNYRNTTKELEHKPAKQKILEFEE
ncbi:MAG: hypothetical protein QXG05_07355 [Nitrososphaerota archaeon]